MSRNRLVSQLEGSHLPQPRAAHLTPQAFIFCPPALVPQAPWLLRWQQSLYERAFAEAQAVARPSLPERDLLGVWN